MPYSRVSYTGNGSTVEYTLPFPLLSLASLEVRVATVLKTLGTDYTVNLSTSKVTFTTAPANAAAISLKRVTPRGVDDRLVVFTDPSDLNAATLNLSDCQLLYIIQEALDDIAEGIGVGGSGGGGGWGGGDPLTDPDLGPVLTDIINAHNTDVANLNTEVLARAAALLAEHDARVAALLAEQDARSAAIITESSARVSGDTALASSITVINAQIGDGTTGLANAHARVTAEATARASADTAQATRISTLESQVQTATTGALARIATIESTLTSGIDNTALAFRVSTLEAQVATSSGSTLLSRIATEESTRASAVSSLASTVSTVSATASTANTNAGTALTNASNALTAANAASASVSAEASARATADGNLSGQYVLKVTAGSRVAGMRITSVSSPAAGDTSEVVFDAAVFKVYNGSANEVPFSVVGGQVCAQRIRVGSGLNEVQVGDVGSIGVGIIKQGRFQTSASSLSTLSSWASPTHGIHIVASDSVGYLGGLATLYSSSPTLGESFTLSADGRFATYEVKTDRILSKTATGWTAPLWDGAHWIEFQWNSGLFARIDKTEVKEITIT